MGIRGSCGHSESENESRRRWERKSKPRSRDDFSLTGILVAGVVLSFALFVSSIVFGFVKSNETSQHVNMALDIIQSIKIEDEGGVRQLQIIMNETVEYFRTLMGYQKESSNANMIALIYGIMSTTLVAGMGWLVQSQKKQVEGFDEKMRKKEEELNKLEESMHAMKSETEFQQSMQQINLALMCSAQLCGIITINPNTQDISASVTSLRDVFKEIEDDFIIIQRNSDLPATSKEQLSHNLSAVYRQLEIAKEIMDRNKWEGAYEKETSVELIESCQGLLNLLELKAGYSRE
jgi:hypothetical protein